VNRLIFSKSHKAYTWRVDGGNLNCRILYFVAGIATLVSLAQGQAVQSNWTAPRTPDGRPDFQGCWANNIATPLERPGELAGRPLLTDEEVAAGDR